MAAGARCVWRAGRRALRAGTCRGRRERRGSRGRPPPRGRPGGAGAARPALRAPRRAVCQAAVAKLSMFRKSVVEGCSGAAVGASASLCCVCVREPGDFILVVRKRWLKIPPRSVPWEAGRWARGGRGRRCGCSGRGGTGCERFLRLAPRPFSSFLTRPLGLFENETTSVATACAGDRGTAVRDRRTVRVAAAPGVLLNAVPCGGEDLPSVSEAAVETAGWDRQAGGARAATVVWAAPVGQTGPGEASPDLAGSVELTRAGFETGRSWCIDWCCFASWFLS